MKKTIGLIGLITVLASSCISGRFHRFSGAGLMKDNTPYTAESPKPSKPEKSSLSAARLSQQPEEENRFSGEYRDRKSEEAVSYPDTLSPKNLSDGSCFREQAVLPEDTTKKQHQQGEERLKEEIPTEPLSQIAFVLAIAGVVLGFFLPFIGVPLTLAAGILAIISLDKIYYGRKKYRGRKQAWWALALSIIYLAIIILAVLFFVFFAGGPMI